MKIRTLAAATTAVAVIASLAACSSGDTADTAEDTGTLTIGMSSAPTSMNPALGVAAAFSYFSYDPLIYQTPDGEFIPDLATEWGYTDDSSQVFELTLREGVTFGDGSPLNADAVKASLDYFLEAGGPNTRYTGPVDSIVAVDELTVEVHYTEPYPDAERSLSQDFSFGQIIGPTGLAAPDDLETTSDGIGQYVLDDSVAGTEYTFAPNENYFNKDAIAFDKVVVKAALGGDAAVSALQSGQIQYAQNIGASGADDLEKAGYPLSKGTSSWSGLILADRENAPLDDETVRQALSYAIDRDALIDTVFAGYAEPRYQLAGKTDVGYSESIDEKYSYDPEKAKSLLADAGYADGFTLTMMTTETMDEGSLLGQSLQSQFADIGVTVELSTVPAASFSALSEAIFSKQYAGIVAKVSGVGVYNLMDNFLPTTALFNPFQSVDDEADRLVSAVAAETDASAQAELLGELNAHVTDLGWVIPVATSYNLQGISPTLANVPETFATIGVNPVAPDESLAWKYAD